MELSVRIKQLRYKAKLTQEQLAERLGISAQSVSKWETGVSMPDITLLPPLAETFGVTIDDLFDLTAEQRMNRIENRLDVEDDLPQDVFRAYEEFLNTQLAAEMSKNRAAELMAYLYWHRMNAAAQKVSRYAREAIRRAPGEKKCQWMLGQAERHAVWDWNIANHNTAIDFYRGIVEENPDVRQPYQYLIDNLIADHRADEAERYLDRLCALKDTNPVLCKVYRAYIALARFDEKTADQIMEALVRENPDHAGYLFEAAQYRAMKCDYGKAIEYYEQSFEKDPDRPRFIDALQGIADIYEIMGDYRKAAETCDRIIGLLKTEWNMTEEVELKEIMKRKERLLEKLQKN